MTQHFDTVVVGGRLSATVTAALLAKRGLRVLLIDQGELASVDGNLLPDLAPSDDASSAMAAVHKELGVQEEIRAKRVPIRPWLQAVFPDRRLELSVNRDQLHKEIKRELGNAAEAVPVVLEALDRAETEVGAYLDEADELPSTRGFWSFGMSKTERAAKRHALAAQSLTESGLMKDVPEPILELLLATLPFLTHLDARVPEDAKVARFARPVTRLLRGFSRINAYKGLRGLFLDVAGRRAFEERRGAIEELQPGKKLTLRMTGGREEVTADTLIDASADLSGLETIPSRLQKKDLALMFQEARPRGFLHVVGFEVDERVLPPGMGAHVLLLNGRKDPERLENGDTDTEDRPIWVVQRPGRKEGRIQLVAAHPVSSARFHAQGFDQLEEIMRARIERLVPFIMDGHPEIATLSGRGATRDRRPVLSHPLYDPGRDPSMGLTGISMRTPFKNLFVAGPTVLPGLGVEGEYVSALQASNAVMSLRPKS